MKSWVRIPNDELWRVDTFSRCLERPVLTSIATQDLASYKLAIRLRHNDCSEETMKNVIFAALALAVLCTASAVAQDQGQDRYDQQAQSNHHRYRIQNSEAIRAHEGHHVKVNARLHEDDRSLEVRSVKRLPESDQRDH